MKRPRPIAILALSATLAVFLAIIGHVLGSDKRDRGYLENAEKLERIARYQFENDRGLPPCNGRERQLLDAARSRLMTMGESNADPVVVVASAFSEIEIIAFGPDYIRTYRFPGQTGFSPPTSGWFSPAPQKISDVSLTAMEQFEIVTPIVRHVRYAMTARESGYDGVNIYFGSGEDDCAFAWTPRGPGPGGLIADMITEASGRAPSTTRLHELAKSIDRADGTRQAGQQTPRP